MQDTVLNHLLPMVQGLSPLELRIFIIKLPVSVKALAGVLSVLGVLTALLFLGVTHELLIITRVMPLIQ